MTDTKTKLTELVDALSEPFAVEEHEYRTVAATKERVLDGVLRGFKENGRTSPEDASYGSQRRLFREGD